MTDTAPTIPALEQIRNRFSKVKLKAVKKILIASSIQPHSIVASSILCRAILREKMLFHVKFFDSIVTIEDLDRHLKPDPSILLLAVGLDIVGTSSSHPTQFLEMGVRFHPTLDTLDLTPLSHPVAAEALAFVEEKMEVFPEEIGLAGVSTLLEESKSAAAKTILDTCMKQGLIALRKGFRIPGFNFLAMDEVFANNVHPYLDSLSGAPESCQRIFDDADISFSKWSTPLSALTSNEARQLNAVLLLSLSGAAIPHVLGSDHEILYEKASSPLRHLSGISSLSRIIWSKHEMGLLLGVLIGDRARLLTSLIDTYRSYCRETILSVTKLKAQLHERQDTTSFSDNHILIRTSDVAEDVAPDVGRILLESTIAKDARFLLIASEQSLSVVWKKSISLLSVSAALLKRKIPLISTSAQSVRIPDASDNMCKKVIEVMNESTKDV